MTHEEKICSRIETLLNTPTDLHHVVKRLGTLEIIVENLIEKIQFFEDNTAKNISNPTKPFHKVESIFFTEEYQYKGKDIHRFIVTLENHNEPYTMDRTSNNQTRITSGDLIYCKIDGNKLKDVKILYEVQ